MQGGTQCDESARVWSVEKKQLMTLMPSPALTSWVLLFDPEGQRPGGVTLHQFYTCCKQQSRKSDEAKGTTMENASAKRQKPGGLVEDV
jgi:hypothetical protein